MEATNRGQKLVHDESALVLIHPATRHDITEELSGAPVAQAIGFRNSVEKVPVPKFRSSLEHNVDGRESRRSRDVRCEEADEPDDVLVAERGQGSALAAHHRDYSIRMLCERVLGVDFDAHLSREGTPCSCSRKRRSIFFESACIHASYGARADEIPLIVLEIV